MLGHPIAILLIVGFVGFFVLLDYFVMGPER